MNVEYYLIAAEHCTTYADYINTGVMNEWVDNFNFCMREWGIFSKPEEIILP